jgi:hypothetical protein
MPLTLPDGTKLSDAEVAKVLQEYQTDCPAVLELFDRTHAGPHDDLRAVDLLSLNALNAFGRAPPMTR